MKKPIIYLFAFLLLATGGTALALNSKTEPAPEKEIPVVKTSLEENAPVEATPKTGALTEVAFTEDSHAFGEVAFEVPAKHTFRFTNTGNQPLTIENVKPSCGCTATNYSKEAIPVGGEGFVELTYNAKKVGIFRKTATVTMNTEPRNKILSISGEVVK